MAQFEDFYFGKQLRESKKYLDLKISIEHEEIPTTNDDSEQVFSQLLDLKYQ